MIEKTAEVLTSAVFSACQKTIKLGKEEGKVRSRKKEMKVKTGKGAAFAMPKSKLFEIHSGKFSSLSSSEKRLQNA